MERTLKDQTVITLNNKLNDYLLIFSIFQLEDGQNEKEIRKSSIFKTANFHVLVKKSLFFFNIQEAKLHYMKCGGSHLCFQSFYLKCNDGGHMPVVLSFSQKTWTEELYVRNFTVTFFFFSNVLPLRQFNLHRIVKICFQSFHLFHCKLHAFLVNFFAYVLL